MFSNFDKLFVRKFLSPTVLLVRSSATSTTTLLYYSIPVCHFLLDVWRWATTLFFVVRSIDTQYSTSIFIGFILLCERPASSVLHSCGSAPTSYFLPHHLLTLLPAIQSTFPKLTSNPKLRLIWLACIPSLQFTLLLHTWTFSLNPFRLSQSHPSHSPHRLFYYDRHNMPCDHGRDRPRGHLLVVIDPKGYVRHPSVLPESLCLIYICSFSCSKFHLGRPQISNNSVYNCSGGNEPYPVASSDAKVDEILDYWTKACV